MKRLIPFLVICSVILAAMIEGCAVHKVRTPRLQTEIPAQYQGTAGDNDVSSAQGSWWRSFGDPVLNQLMDAAFAGNLDLARYAARLRQALALSRQTTADKLPHIDLSGSAGRSQQLSAAGETVGDSRSVALVAGYEVDLWRKIQSRALVQQLQANATRHDLHALYLSLSAQVAEQYYAMVEQRAKLRLIDQTIAARADTLDLVTLRYNEGMVSALDLYQARQNLANARAQRPNAEALLATAGHTLAVLTGGYPTQDIGGELAELPDVPDAFPMGLPADLLQQRPDIQAAMRRLEADDYQIAVAVADRFPSINLVADYGHSRSDYGTALSGTVWRLVGNLTMPLIDFDKRKAEVARTEAVYAERLATYQQTVLGAFQEVEDALVANRQAKQNIAKLRVEATAAADTLRLAVAEYKDGLSTYLPVLTAQTAYFDSQSRMLSARRQLIGARISLAKAVGGDWMAPAATKRMQATKKDPT